jgi:hypothetical protein
MKFLPKILLVLFFSYGLSGCGDEQGPTNVYATQNTSATVSGKVVIAHDGSGLGNAKVRLRIGGMWREVISTVATDHRAGDFIFSGLPINAAFYIQIEPSESTLSRTYSFGSTQTTDAGEDIDGGTDEFNSTLASHDVGNLHVYNNQVSTITMKDVDDGSLISGLSMYIEPVAFLTGDNKIGSVSAPWVPANEENGVYSYNLPIHGRAINIFVSGLMTSAGVQYQTLAGDQLAPGIFDNGTVVDSGAGAHDDANFSDRLLTAIVAEQNIDVFLRKSNAHLLTVAFELFDASGAVYTAAGAAITVTETASGNILSAAQDAAQPNRYTLTTNFRNNLTYQVGNLDLNGDSFPDTQAATVFAATANLNGETSVNIPVTITEMNTKTDVIADILSTSIVPGLTAEATIAFNQPVTAIGTTPALVQVYALDLTADADADDDLAPLATVLNSSGAAGGVALTTPNGTNFAQYTYTDNAAATKTFTLPSTSTTTGVIADPFETHIKSTESIVSATLTATNSSNTIFQLVMDAAAITDLQKVNFSLLVRAVGSDVTQVVSNSLWATSTATASLTDFVVDDGDFNNTPLTNEVTNAPTLIRAENPALEYALSLTSTLGACGTADCVFRARNKPIDKNVGANQDILSMVIPSAFYGTIKLVNYVVVSNVSGTATDTTTTVFNSKIQVSSTQKQADAMADAADTNDADLTDVRGNYEYFLADPSNQSLEDKGGNTFDDVFGDTAVPVATREDFNSFSRGYVRTGLGFRVKLDGLNIPAVAAGTFLKSVTVDIDAVIAGQRQTGQVTLAVQ